MLDIKELLSKINLPPWVVTSYEGTSKSGKHIYSICADSDGKGLSEDHTCVGETHHEDEKIARINAEAIVWIMNNAKTLIDTIETADWLINEHIEENELNFETESMLSNFKTLMKKLDLK